MPNAFREKWNALLLLRCVALRGVNKKKLIEMEVLKPNMTSLVVGFESWLIEITNHRQRESFEGFPNSKHKLGFHTR